MTYDKNDFRINSLTKGEYENCVFNNCDFSNSDLTDIKFLECKFLGCNMSMTNLTKTALRDINFKDCKMLGLRFENCNQFGFNVHFDNCDLTRSTFENTIIEKADFRTSFNYSIDPEINRIKKTKLSLTGIVGLLDKYDIEIE